MENRSGKCECCEKLCESRCASCRVVFYCCLDHQKKDWRKHKPNCSNKKYMLERNEKLGQYMVAGEDLKPDTLILKEKPIIIGPKQGVSDFDETYSAEFCLGCYKNNIDFPKLSLHPCVTCGLSICSAACSDQYFHKNFECRFIYEVKQATKETSPNEEFNLGSISTKIIQFLMYFRCILLEFFDEKHFTMLMLLESNLEAREDLQNLEKTARVFRDLVDLFSYFNHKTILTVNKPDLHKIIGIIDTNYAEIKISTGFDVLGVYSTFSKLEHNCCPNTRFYFVPCPDKKAMFELCCRSSIKIKKGQHLSVTYTNILWNTEKRRDVLKKQRFFWCDCERCTDPLELGSNFSTLICPVQDCSAFCTPVRPPNTPEANSYWQCQKNNNKANKCGKICESWQVKKVDGKLSEIVKTMLPTVQNYKDLLAKIEELVHPDYYLNFVVNHSLIQMLGQSPTTKNDAQVLDEKLKLCNRLIGLIKKLDPGMAALHIYAGVIYYEMHSAILAMVGGEGDEDYLILRKNPESVKLSKVYLQKCIECFQFELLDLPETKLKVLANKKLEYLNMLVKK